MAKVRMKDRLTVISLSLLPSLDQEAVLDATHPEQRAMIGKLLAQLDHDIGLAMIRKHIQAADWRELLSLDITKDERAAAPAPLKNALQLWLESEQAQKVMTPVALQHVRAIAFDRS